MKKYLILFMVSLCVLPSNAQRDVIIKRDATEMNVKIIRMAPNETVYKLDEKKKSAELLIDNSEIYMIKYEKRGNVFFSENGETFLGKEQKLPRDAHIIYLKAGAEIVAYELEMDTENIKYKNVKKKNVEKIKIPKKNVFMIKYPDGTKDVLSEFQSIRNKQVLPQQTPLPISQQGTIVASKLEAVIKTRKNAIIKAVVVGEDNGVLSFYKENEPSGPLYQISRDMIKSIDYVK